VTECAVYRMDTRARVWHGDLDLTVPQTVEFDPIPGPVTILFAWVLPDGARFQYGSQSAPHGVNVTKTHVPALLPPVGSITLPLAPMPWV